MNNQPIFKRFMPIIMIVFFIFSGMLGAAPLVTPEAAAPASPADFNLDLAINHLERIAQVPRPMGSPASRQVRTYLLDELFSLGLEPELQSFQVNDYFSGSSANLEIANIMVRIPGTAPTKAVALVAHYDTVPSTPGANDNGASVALLLELARAILAGPPVRDDIILLFTDGEEPAPRFGATAFIEDHPWADEIRFVINLEAIGSEGPSTIIAANGNHSEIIALYSEAAPYPAAFSFIPTTAGLIDGSVSDFSAFKSYHYPGIEFAYLRGSSIYHTPADSLDTVNRNSLFQQGANTLAFTRRISDADLSEVSKETAADYFNLGRGLVVRYSPLWSLVAAIGAGVMILITVARQKAWVQTLGSAGITILSLASSAAVAYAAWLGICTWQGNLEIGESYWYLVGLMLLTTAIVLGPAGLARRKLSQSADASGVLFIYWLLGLLAAIFAPGMGYLFIWPTLAGAIATLHQTIRKNSDNWQLILSLPAVGIALVVFAPVVDSFFSFAQPRPGNPDSEMLPMIIAPVIFLGLAVELIRALWLRAILRPAGSE